MSALLPQLDNLCAFKGRELQLGLGFLVEPVLPQHFGKARVSGNGDVSRHGPMYSAAVDKVDVLPAKLDFRRLFDKNRQSSEVIHISPPLTRLSRRGAADSAKVSGTHEHTLIKVLTKARVSSLFSAPGRRLAPVARLFTPPGAA